MNSYDVIVLGGGAAGLMCAQTAGKRGRSVLVLEGANKIGKKILMSGGGRCNFTNLHCSADHFLSENEHFSKSALSRYTQHDFIALVEQHGIEYHEKTLGQLFCDHSSKDILNALVQECDTSSVKILTECDVQKVTRPDNYLVETSAGDYTAESVVVATGGLSIPRMGATDFGFRLARQFGLPVIDTSAGLVPFTFSGELQAMMERLAGVSLDAQVDCNTQSFSEGILFTHRGLSGPAILQISSYWKPGESIVINLLPNIELENYLLERKQHEPRSGLRNILCGLLPKALVLELEKKYWLEHAEQSVAEISDLGLSKISAQLQAWDLKPTATEGYRTAEVTLGGVDTAVLSSKTMECSDQPGLYFIGEVVDVTGHLGGFNFQWAWASGYAAGIVV